MLLPFLIAISSANRLWYPIPPIVVKTKSVKLMFHAQCRELSLSTGAFSRSHAYDRYVAAPGPYTIQHWGGKPLHQRMLIVSAPRTHVHGYPISRLVLCWILYLTVLQRYLRELAQSQHCCIPFSGVQLPDLLARCGAE